MLESQPISIPVRPNILILEDEEGPREALKLILKGKYNIFTSQNGSEALKILENIPIDLITVDLKLPGTPGHQLLKDFRRIQPDAEMVIISGFGTFESAVAGIRHGVSEFITKPFSVMDIISTVHRLLEKARRRKAISQVLDNLPHAATPENTLPGLRLAFGPLGNAAVVSESNLLEFARVLATTLDAQDPYTHGHSERVAHYSVHIAEEFGFTPEECHDLMIAAYLHDIGKIGISREILSKRGMLTPEEQKILRTHPQLGVDLVEPLGLSPMAYAVIRNHHERWDGNGYPDGLIGDQIHLAARVVCVADCYDAMTSDRPYRAPYSRAQTVTELRQGCCHRYDPDVVEVFLDNFKNYV